jgi:hypothetical protein
LDRPFNLAAKGYGFLIYGLGNAEISHLYCSLSSNQYIMWFDIPVNNTSLMSMVDSLAYHEGNVNRLFNR